jgi:hypothetical protein
MDDLRVRDQWMVEVFGEPIGPLSTADVLLMVRERTLIATDRIRSRESEVWRSIGDILSSQSRQAEKVVPCFNSLGNEPEGTALQADTPGAIYEDCFPGSQDHLEKLILDILAQPITCRDTLSLSQLDIVISPRSDCHESESDSSMKGKIRSQQSYPRFISPWPRMRLFRRHKCPKSASCIAPDILGLGSESVTPIPASSEREFISSATEDVPERDSQRPFRLSWLELLLAIFGMLLVLQLVPSTWSTIASWCDPRGWAFKDLAVVSGVFLFTLLSIKTWKH